jgi:decaprenyl-phosphate phosphoribosyltransferase
VLRTSAIAFIAFCLAASCIYYVNDVMDVESDRRHPKKRFRPIAAGWVPIPVALVVGPLCGLAALGVAALANWTTVGVVGFYIVLHIVYSLWLKHVPVLDLAMVASGFLLRAIVGGVAADLELSQWFLLTTGFGSLFMVAGKRYAEIKLRERTGVQIRRSLNQYSTSYLRFVWGMSATVLIATYGLWAFDNLVAHHRTMWSVISMVPFVVAVLRYAVEVDQGNGGEPEEIALADRVLQVLAVAWVATLVLTVYV